MRFSFSSFVFLLIVLGTSLLSSAQIFRVQGGASTLFGANGASVNIKAPGYEGDIGAGALDGHFQYGFLVRTNLLGNTLSVGDDTVKVELPTDVFDASHYFLARGVGLQHIDPKTKGMWYGFAGTTSLGFSTPFFMASRSQSGLGIIYFERQLTDKIRFVSRNLFSDHQTAIQGLEWSALRGVKLSASAGLGSNQPYFASALKVDRENFVLRAAYIAEGTNFQRMQVPSPVSTEPEKTNIAAMYRFNRHLSVRGSHENILQPAIDGRPTLRATVDEAYTNFNVAHFDFGAGTVESRTGGRSNLGLNFYTTHAISHLVSVTANMYQSRPNQGAVSNTFTTTIREQLNQKLALTQTAIRSNGQTTAAFGGEFVANRLNAFVGYQTVYVPFRPDNAFQQALGFNVRVSLPRNMQLTAGSFVDPQGKVRYTVGIGTYLYRVRGMSGTAATAQSFRFPKFVSEGIVVEANGQPIEGAAIHVDGKVAYSNSDGRFMMRLDKVGPHAVVVAMDEFTTAGVWEVVEAPASTLAQPEDEVTPIHIVLRRVPAKKLVTSGN
jgi:hypothetical protein